MIRDDLTPGGAMLVWPADASRQLQMEVAYDTEN